MQFKDQLKSGSPLLQRRRSLCLSGLETNGSQTTSPIVTALSEFPKTIKCSNDVSWFQSPTKTPQQTTTTQPAAPFGDKRYSSVGTSGCSEIETAGNSSSFKRGDCPDISEFLSDNMKFSENRRNSFGKCSEMSQIYRSLSQQQKGQTDEFERSEGVDEALLSSVKSEMWILYLVFIVVIYVIYIKQI